MANPDATLSMLEAMSARLEIITRSLERTAEAVEANSAQVASLSESITRLEIQIKHGFGRIETLIQQQLELSRQQLELSRQQHETTVMQGRHIDRLMAITEMLIQQLSDNSTDSTPYTPRASELENSKVEWLSDSSPNGNGNGHSPPRNGDRGDHTPQPLPQQGTSPGERLSGHSTNGNGHTQQTVVRDLTEEELAELLGGGGDGS